MASGTSKKTELKLTNVAAASLEELRLDYEDFLRQRELALWAEDDPRRKALVARRGATADEVAAWVKETYWGHEKNGRDGRDGQNGQDGQNEKSIVSMKSMSSIKDSRDRYAETAANAALVGVAGALLRRQIRAQAADFEKEGGFTERLYRIRKQRRNTS